MRPVLQGASRAPRPLCAPLSPGIPQGAIVLSGCWAEGYVTLLPACRGPQDLTPVLGPCDCPPTPPPPPPPLRHQQLLPLPEPPGVIGVILPLVTKRSRHCWWGLVHEQ